MSMASSGEEFSLSIAELQKRDDEQLRIADLAIRNVYIRRVSDVLHTKLDQRRSHEIAEQLLDGASIEDVIGKSNWEPEIANVCKEYQGLRDTTFLLIGAPRSNTCLTIDQDREARDKQLQLFYNIITKNHDREKCIKVDRSVYSYRLLKQYVHAFMTDDAVKSKRAYIVFNGHGKESGHLSLEKEDNPISNSLFIKDIYESWKAHKKPRDMDEGAMVLPQRITVILAHCYGYKHEVEGNAKDIIDVICLTNPLCPKTKFVYKMNSRRDKVKDALHIELTNLARDMLSQSESIESNSSSTSSIQSPVSATDDDVWNNDTTETSDVEWSSNNVQSVVDATTLACLAFCKDKQSSGRSAGNKMKQDSGTSFLKSLGTFDFSIKKCLKKENSILKMMAASATQLATCALGDSMENINIEYATTKSKRGLFTRQKKTEASFLSSSMDDGTTAVASSSPVLTESIKDIKLTSKKSNPMKHKDKKCMTGGLTTLVALSSTIGQVVNNIDAKNCSDA